MSNGPPPTEGRTTNTLKTAQSLTTGPATIEDLPRYQSRRVDVRVRVSDVGIDSCASGDECGR